MLATAGTTVSATGSTAQSQFEECDHKAASGSTGSASAMCATVIMSTLGVPTLKGAAVRWGNLSTALILSITLETLFQFPFQTFHFGKWKRMAGEAGLHRFKCPQSYSELSLSFLSLFWSFLIRWNEKPVI